MVKTKLVWKKGMQFDAYTPGKDEPIPIDSEAKFGGIGYGYQPKPLMLVALAGCTALDVASLMKKMRIDEDVDDFNVDVDAHMTEEHPKFFDKVHVIYNFKGKNLNHEKLTKCVTLSESRYCGVYKMFRSFAEVTYEINFIED
ncbi:MAG TPA: OsmC family peroxiredoxin [Flavobacteriia bacterium]|jgi:putative redox protein|nr:OsmC family peroxiredoxin [Flavobacteriia bacterium]